MKKLVVFLLAAAMSLSVLSGCTPAAPNSAPAPSAAVPSAPAPVAEPQTIKVAAIETAYGSAMWQKVAEAFTAETGIKVDLVTDKMLEDVIGPQMKAGDYPDVIHLATGREKA
ncbi:MAG: carbohydrate ABC transporter substrate-binding protein, partial [Angelakisella sp.]